MLSLKRLPGDDDEGDDYYDEFDMDDGAESTHDPDDE